MPQPSAMPWPHAPAGQGQWGSRTANATASWPFFKFLVKAANANNRLGQGILGSKMSAPHSSVEQES